MISAAFKWMVIMIPCSSLCECVTFVWFCISTSSAQKKHEQVNPLLVGLQHHMEVPQSLVLIDPRYSMKAVWVCSALGRGVIRSCLTQLGVWWITLLWFCFCFYWMCSDGVCCESITAGFKWDGKSTHLIQDDLKENCSVRNSTQRQVSACSRSNLPV